MNFQFELLDLAGRCPLGPGVPGLSTPAAIRATSRLCSQVACDAVARRVEKYVRGRRAVARPPPLSPSSISPEAASLVGAILKSTLYVLARYVLSSGPPTESRTKLRLNRTLYSPSLLPARVPPFAQQVLQR